MIQTIITSDSVAAQSTLVTSAVIIPNDTTVTCAAYRRRTRHIFWDAVMFPQASCWAGLMPTAPIWRNPAAHLQGPRTHGGLAHYWFLKMWSVIPRKALGLNLCLNFEKIREDFDEQKVRKCNYVWFGFNFFKLHKCLTDWLIDWLKVDRNYENWQF